MKTDKSSTFLAMTRRTSAAAAAAVLAAWLAQSPVMLAATRTWQGDYSGYWSAAQNWEENIAPVAGDDLIFPQGAAHLTNTNNIGNVTFNSIVIDGVGYTLRGLGAGVTIGLTGWLNANYGIIDCVIELNVVLEDDLSLGCAYGTTMLMSGDVDLGGHELTLLNAGEIHLGGIISGSGSLLQSSGILFLEGASANTFTGETRVVTGMLLLDKTSGNAVQFGQLIIGTGGGSANSVIVREKNDYQIGALPVTVHSDGWLDLVDHVDTVGDLAFDGGTASSTTGMLLLGGNVTVSSNGGTISGRLGLGTSTRVVDVATTGNLRVEASVSGTGGITKTNNGFLTLVTSNSYAGVTTLQGGFLEVQDNHGLGTTTGGTLLQNGTLRLVGVTVAGESLAATGGKLQALAASNAWTGPITLSGDTIIEMPNAGQVLNLTGVMDGAGGFTKTGPGTAILSGTTANAHTGNTRVTEGELRLSKPSGQAIQGGSLLVGSSANPDVCRVLYTADHQIANDVTINLTNAAELDLNGHNDTVGPFIIGGGYVTTGDGLLTLSGDITTVAPGGHYAYFFDRLSLGASARTISVESAGELRILATLSGSGPLTKTGPGALRLAESNTHSGLTRVAEGALWVDHPQALGSTSSGTVVSNDATLLIYNDTGITNEPLILHGQPGSPARLRASYGTNHWVGDIWIEGDCALSASTATDVLTVLGGIGGPGSLIKNQSGTVVFGGTEANTYTGGTRVDSGTLVLRNTAANGAIPGPLVIGDGSGGAEADVVRVELGNQIANTAPVIVNSSGLLNLTTGLADAIGSLSGNGTVDLSSADLYTGYDNTSTTFSGLIRGSTGCELNKTGNGTFTLTGNSTYPGWTHVMNGTLVVQGSQPIGPVSVSADGTLSGTGTVGNLESIGSLRPGTSPGILTCSNLNLSGGTDYYVELNGPTAGTGYDQLSVRGTNQLGSPFLHVTLGYLPAVGDSFRILNNDGTDAVSGTFASLPDGASLTVSNATLRIDYDAGTGNDVVLRVTNVTAVAPLRFTSAVKSGSAVLLTWEGGVPFYVVEKKAALTNATWDPVTGPMRETQTNLPTTTPAGFYRVKGGN